ncbi:MAG: helix-turn-helix domain-containing protein [Myxococcales bacterium]|nr:helix-turn-helix domain-containing protein [Myxococcales bacterium]
MSDRVRSKPYSCSRASSIDAFLAAPCRQSVSGPHYIVHCPTPTLAVTTFWGEPTVDEIEQLLRLFDVAAMPSMRAPIDGVMNGQALTGVDPRAFSRLLEFVRARHSELRALLRRQAILLPSGVLAATMAGFFALLRPPYPIATFETLEAALAWLSIDEPESWANALERDALDARGGGSLLYQLRAHLATQRASASVDGAASALGMSTRSLQRRLSECGVSFRHELARARIEHAKRALETSDAKLADVARTAGFASVAHFIVAFRTHTGQTPAAYRAALTGA